MAGYLWGPTPTVMRWVYTSIVQPKLTYGSIVWAHWAGNYQKILNRIQSLAMTGLTFMQRTTPAAGLEAILDLMPLELHALSTACSAAFRIREQNQKQDGVREGHLRGHLHSLVGTQEKVGLKNIPSNKHIGRQWHKCYYVDQNSMNDGTPIWGSFIKCYTDSSLIKGMCQMGLPGAGWQHGASGKWRVR